MMLVARGYMSKYLLLLLILLFYYYCLLIFINNNIHILIYIIHNAMT